MAYYKGKLDGNRAYCSGRYGSCTVNVSEANSDLMLVTGKYGKRYGVWMRQTNSGAQGEKIFPRTAVRVTLDEKNMVHVWIRSLATRRKAKKK